MMFPLNSGSCIFFQQKKHHDDFEGEFGYTQHLFWCHLNVLSITRVNMKIHCCYTKKCSSKFAKAIVL